MDSWEIWFYVVSIAQSMGCAWIYSLFQKRAYKKDIRSRHSYVLLGMLLAKEEKLPYYFSGSREEGIGETYLRLPEGIIKVFSWGVDGFAISLVGAVKVDDMLASKAREFCKELNAKENRVRYSVGFDPIVSETCFTITCNFEEEADGDGEDAAEYYILSYAKTYLIPKQQELQMAWEHRMEELKKEKV